MSCATLGMSGETLSASAVYCRLSLNLGSATIPR